MAKNSGPDPRFDPRFQRGYDGPEPDVPATPAASSPVEPGASSRGPAAASASSERGDGVGDGGGPPGPTDLDAPSAGPDGEGLWPPPRRNPFALVLLIGSLAMIGVGIWLFWTVVTASTFPNGYDKASQAFALAQQQLTPALLIAGVLGLIGWFVLGALASDPRGE